MENTLSRQEGQGTRLAAGFTGFNADGRSTAFLRALRQALLLVVVGLVALFLVFVALDRVRTIVVVQADRFSGAVQQGSFEDYIAFYAAGKLVLEGQGQDLYSTEVITATEHDIAGREVGGTGGLGFYNPPFVAVMFAPLALLPLDVAAMILLVANLLLVVVAASIVYRLLDLRGHAQTVFYILGVASLQSIFWLVGHGQLSMLLVMGFLGFYCYQKQNRPGMSGLSLALLLVKPQTAVLPLLVLLSRRQWSALLPFAGVAGMLALLSVAVSGISVLWEYPAYALGSTGWEGRFGIDVAGMYGWSGFLASLLNNHSAAHVISSMAASLLTIAVVVRSFRGPWSAASDMFAPATGVMIVGAILVNPHVYLQDTVLAALVVALGAVGWRESRQGGSLWAGAACLVWLSQYFAFRARDALGVNIVTPVLVALLILLQWRLRKNAAPMTAGAPRYERRDLPRSALASRCSGGRHTNE